MYIVIYEVMRKGKPRKFVVLPDIYDDVMEADKVARQTAAKTKSRSWLTEFETPPVVEPVEIPTSKELDEYERVLASQKPTGVPFADK